MKKIIFIALLFTTLSINSASKFRVYTIEKKSELVPIIVEIEVLDVKTIQKEPIGDYIPHHISVKGKVINTIKGRTEENIIFELSKDDKNRKIKKGHKLLALLSISKRDPKKYTGERRYIYLSHLTHYDIKTRSEITYKKVIQIVTEKQKLTNGSS